MSCIQITFRSIPYSSTIEYHIKKHFNKLSRIYTKINNCKVVIDAEQKNRQTGKLFSINIYMTIPGHEIVCKKQNQNIYLAIRHGFNGIDKLLLKKHCKRKLTLTDNFLCNRIEHKNSETNTSSSIA